MAQLDFQVFDADNHYYEAEDAFTRHIEPSMRKRCMLMGSDYPHAEGLAEPTDYVYELKDFSAEEIRLVMRDNALGLSQRRPA